MATAQPPAADEAAAPKRRQLSCLGKTVIAFIDGGAFGAAIGGIVASAQGVSSLASGTESFVGMIRGIAGSGMRSGLSLGGALAGYTGGVCTLERTRGRRDGFNPFLVGGLMGALGSVQRIEYHDGQHRGRALSINPRAMLGSSVSSAMLCTLFWYIQQPGRNRREEEQQQTPQPPVQAGVPASTMPKIPALAGQPSAAADQLTSASPEMILTDGQAGEVETPLMPTSGLAQGLLPDSFMNETGDTPDAATSAPSPLAPPRAAIDAPDLDASKGSMPADGFIKDPWAK